MAVHNEQSRYNVVAAADLTGLQYRVINLNGTLATAVSQVAGVNISSVRSGELATYIYEGIAKVMAGGTVTTPGFPLALSSSGTLVAASSGGFHVGRALESAASGDLFRAFVDFKTLPAWAGV